MIDFIKSILSKDGDQSAKRFVVIWLLIVFTIYIFTKPIDQTVIYAILGSITLILGVGALTRS